MAKDHSKKTIHAPPRAAGVELVDTSSALGVEIDLEKYRPYLEGDEYSDEQKLALIESLFRIMGAFVDLGFGIHPVQTACGQVENTSPEGPKSTANKVYSKPSILTSNFDTAAEGKTVPAAGKAAS